MRTSRRNDATRFVAGVLLVGSIASDGAAQRHDPAAAELAGLINAWRRGEADCDGKRLTPSAPLTINPMLASTAVAEIQRPIEALKQRG